jgi:hypothetical protein
MLTNQTGFGYYASLYANKLWDLSLSWYSNSTLIDVYEFHESSSINESLVSEPSSNICFDFCCRAHNFTHKVENIPKNSAHLWGYTASLL